MKTTISRRTLLRGLGGFALALPALEIMVSSRARAEPSAIPKRYAVLINSATATSALFPRQTTRSSRP